MPSCPLNRAAMRRHVSIKNSAHSESWHIRVSFEMSRAKMANLGVTPEMVQRVVEGQNEAADAGKMRVDDKYVRLYPSGDIRTIQDFERLVITIPNGDGSFSTLHLGDLVTVSRDYKEPPTCIVRAWGSGSPW